MKIHQQFLILAILILNGETNNFPRASIFWVAFRFTGLTFVRRTMDAQELKQNLIQEIDNTNPKDIGGFLIIFDKITSLTDLQDQEISKRFKINPDYIQEWHAFRNPPSKGLRKAILKWFKEMLE